MAQTRKISLVGFRFAGKTTFGRALADEISIRFMDIDSLIVQSARKSISEIFKTDGAAYFRLLEEKIIYDTFNSDISSIIAVGGGAVSSSKNRKIIKNNSYVVYLDVEESVLLSRYHRLEMQKDEFRPRLTSLSLEDEVSFLLHQRKPYYQEIADLIIPLENALISENLNVIISKLEKHGPKWLKNKLANRN
ncbi:MAG: shikimate kinase [Promethearchaeota archaeon]